MKRLCTLCVRGESKGVPKKNTRSLAGKPLFVHSFLQARETALFEDIALSSDSEYILKLAKRWGIHRLVQRPAKLATDECPKLPVIQHCMQAVEKETGQCYEVVVDLDASSPLRTTGDIRGAVALLEKTGCPNVITGSPARRSPYFNLVERGTSGGYAPAKTLPVAVTRRQDAPPCFDMNASIYVWRREALLGNKTIFLGGTQLFLMPEERSVDIDSELDLEVVSFLMRRKRKGAK